MYHKNIIYRRRADQIHKAYRMNVGIQCMHLYNLINDTKWQGRLVKGKIHCSCPLCSCKSKMDKGVNTNSISGYSVSDKKKLASLADSMTEYLMSEKIS